MGSKHFRNLAFVVIGLACSVVNGAQLPDLMARLKKLDGKGMICAPTPKAECKWHTLYAKGNVNKKCPESKIAQGVFYSLNTVSVP